jgi:hypothetical protein
MSGARLGFGGRVVHGSDPKVSFAATGKHKLSARKAGELSCIDDWKQGCQADIYILISASYMFNVIK